MIEIEAAEMLPKMWLANNNEVGYATVFRARFRCGDDTFSVIEETQRQDTGLSIIAKQISEKIAAEVYASLGENVDTEELYNMFVRNNIPSTNKQSEDK